MDIITGKILKLNGWPDGKIIGIAKDAAARLLDSGLDRDSVLATLSSVRANPGSFLADETLSDLARECLRANQPKEEESTNLRGEAMTYPIWGRENIDDQSLSQMDNAMRLPISVAGALMPDAHVGYGLPIGGVLATYNAVIPYGVGMDIGCRMRLSVFPFPGSMVFEEMERLKNILTRETRFGNASFHDIGDHELFERKEFPLRWLGAPGQGVHPRRT